MKVAIIQFPGSNCERETILAIRRAGMEPIEFLWNEPQEKLLSCDGCIIIGGFSYEDRCRAGVIASLDPIIKILKTFDQQNKPILGICNGAQILVESGLVPGLKDYQIGMALTTNKRVKNNKVQGTGFYNAWIHVKKFNGEQDAFTKYLTKPICIPTAHAEGRFVLPQKLFDELLQKNVTMLQYCDADGQPHDEFPINPNGSQHSLAAIGNIKGNVLAIMPHPERTINGDVIFQSMHDYANTIKQNALSFQPPELILPKYKLKNNVLEIKVELIITDNAAMSVQMALQKLGYNCKIKRYVHWEIEHHDDTNNLQKSLIEAQELFNLRKEILVDQLPQNNLTILVQDKEDLIGRNKLEIMRHMHEFRNIDEIKKGIIWSIEAENEVTEKIIAQHILFNPYAHDVFTYEEG
jgi:phosphoribosylformylglycinamidine synthase